jgi:transcription initiation factor TFIIIB Brf1 subunit/transcription initiation factor TFIIB
MIWSTKRTKNFQLENPELGTKLAPPKFSDFLKDFAKKDLGFAQNVHDKLTELVKLAKEVPCWTKPTVVLKLNAVFKGFS